MRQFIDRVEKMLTSNGVEISRLDVNEEEFNEEVVWCLDHQMSDEEMVAHFKGLIEDHNGDSLYDSYDGDY